MRVYLLLFGGLLGVACGGQPVSAGSAATVEAQPRSVPDAGANRVAPHSLEELLAQSNALRPPRVSPAGDPAGAAEVQDATLRRWFREKEAVLRKADTAYRDADVALASEARLAEGVALAAGWLAFADEIRNVRLLSAPPEMRRSQVALSAYSNTTYTLRVRRRVDAILRRCAARATAEKIRSAAADTCSEMLDELARADRVLADELVDSGSEAKLTDQTAFLHCTEAQNGEVGLCFADSERCEIYRQQLGADEMNACLSRETAWCFSGEDFTSKSAQAWCAPSGEMCKSLLIARAGTGVSPHGRCVESGRGEFEAGLAPGDALRLEPPTRRRVEISSDDPLAGQFDLAAATAGLERTGVLSATLHTSVGALTCELWEQLAPKTVANFVGLARGIRPWKDPRDGKWKKTPAYNGSGFHRVIKNYMVQGGDPTGTGHGEPGYIIPDENWPGMSHNAAGQLCMANRGKNTGGMQFFILHKPSEALDRYGTYSVFGKCFPQSVIDAIANSEVDGDRALEPVVIKSVTFERK